MRKFAIFLCTVLLLGIVGWQVTDYIINKKEMETAYSADWLESNYTTITITAVGDCTFGTDINSAGGASFDNEVKNQNYDYTYFLRNVKPFFENDDLTIVNFEGTMSDRGTRADKEYAFRGSPEYVNILTSSSVEAANLSNNHSRDYGEVSFTDTQKTLAENNITWFSGRNYGIAEVKGIKIGLVGTNTQRAEETANFINNMNRLKKENPDLIIANFHWGIEREAFPEEKQIKLAHTAIDNGADLVIGHHPHVLQGIERYKGKYILYSLGNFCFGGNKNPDDKDTMIFKQTFVFEDGTLIPKENVFVVPCSISSVSNRNNYQPTPLSDKNFERVRDKIIERSKPFNGIENIEFIEK